MRMIDRVHRHAAHPRALTEPTLAAGLSEVDVLLVRVGHRPHRGHALLAYQAHLARGQAQLGVAGVLGDQLRVGSRRAGDLATLGHLHFDIVDDGADRHVPQRHGVARLDVHPLAGNHGAAGFEPLRGKDVGKLAIVIADQGDEGGTVGVVLEALDRRRNVELAALEVDQAIAALVAAATVAHGHPPQVVAPARTVLAFGQGLDRLALPQFRTVDQHQLALGRRGRFELLQCHGFRSSP